MGQRWARPACTHVTGDPERRMQAGVDPRVIATPACALTAVLHDAAPIRHPRSGSCLVHLPRLRPQHRRHPPPRVMHAQDRRRRQALDALHRCVPVGRFLLASTERLRQRYPRGRLDLRQLAPQKLGVCVHTRNGAGHPGLGPRIGGHVSCFCFVQPCWNRGRRGQRRAARERGGRESKIGADRGRLSKGVKARSECSRLSPSWATVRSPRTAVPTQCPCSSR